MSTQKMNGKASTDQMGNQDDSNSKNEDEKNEAKNCVSKVQMTSQAGNMTEKSISDNRGVHSNTGHTEQGSNVDEVNADNSKVPEDESVEGSASSGFAGYSIPVHENESKLVVNNNEMQATSEEWRKLNEIHIKTLNEEIEKLKDENKNLKKFSNKHVNEKETAQRKILDLVNRSEASKNKVKGIQTELDDMKKKLNLVSEERDTFNNKCVELNQKNKVLSGQSLDMKNQFEVCSLEIADLRKFKEDKEKEKTDYVSMLAGIKAVINEYQVSEKEAMCKYKEVSETMKNNDKELKEVQKKCNEQKTVISDFDKR